MTLDYSKLKHRQIKPLRLHVKKNSFYIRKSIGQVGQYRDNYFGDPSVFKIGRRRGNECVD